jgi:hypothetical protein
MTLAEDVVTLQNRLAAAQREASRAEGAHDAAKLAAENARNDLLNDFNVDSVDAAEALLDELRTDLEHIVEQISAALDRIGV